VAAWFGRTGSLPMMVHRIVVFVALVIVAVVVPSARGVAAAGCAAAYPEAAWIGQPVTTPGLIVEVADVPDGLAARFARELDTAAGWIAGEIGPTTATVCIADPGGSFDTDRFERPGVRFHAVRDLEAGRITLSAERVGQVGPAGAFALAHLALWQRSDRLGWPEPLATAIARWYRARMLQRIVLDHAAIRIANFFDTEARIDWAASRQAPVVAWDPETNDGLLGDMVDFAVRTEGSDVLTDPDPVRWTAIETRWRTALRNELRGSEDDSTGWKGGLAFTLGALALALIVALAGFISKRLGRRRPPTPPPIPGFFEMPEGLSGAPVDQDRATAARVDGLSEGGGR